MPRYIDADAAIELVQLTYCKDCNSYNGVMCRACQFDDAMMAIDDVPAADVVPREEVETLKDNNEHLVCMLLEAKQDVAREIFAEINAIKKEYAAGDIDGNELYIRLYMLEKKYTEEKRHD